MTTPVAALAAFASWSSVDLVMALWVEAVGKRQRFRAALTSMVCALCLLVGIEQIPMGLSVRGVAVGAAWILGYGVGSFVAVTLAARKAITSAEDALRRPPLAVVNGGKET